MALSEDHAEFNERELLKRSEVANELTVSVRTLHRLIDQGEFPKPIRIRRSVRWRRKAVTAYLDRDQKRARRKPSTRQS